MFEDGIALLAGEHHINLDVTFDAVQHAPRRVLVAMRARLKDFFDELQDQQIVTPVTQPPQWIGSLVVVQKKDSSNLRICLDPTNYNRAIQRENYTLPTIEYVDTRLHGAKVFSLLDVRSGFLHVMLDEPSSYLTTFNTPFGRYIWKRLPLGICSAPKIFQRKMHQLNEGLSACKSSLVIGDNEVDAHRSHDGNLLALIQRCEQSRVKLNANKMQLRIPEVPFICHIATADGLRVDPGKVREINEMPKPTDVAAVQRPLE